MTTRRRYLRGLATLVAVVSLASLIHAAPTASASPPWPSGLEGPFELKEMRHQKLTMSDGVQLDGWIFLPDLPDGVRAPVVLASSAYHGSVEPVPNDPASRDDDVSGEVPGDLLVRNGYAVAMYAVRGTGQSGGCHQWLGPREQQDHYELIAWLAAQEWSNGRIGMYGQSYNSATVFEAAVTNPPALKAAITAGNNADWYTNNHSPQGALSASLPIQQLPFIPIQSAAPRAAAAGVVPTDGLSERVCPELVDVLRDNRQGWLFQRDKRFNDERRFTDRLARSRTAFFITHGLHDCGQCWQEDVLWEALKRAPKRMMVGPWGHVFPHYAGVARDEWYAELLGWFDHFLKGTANDAGIGRVDYQDESGTWHTSTAWPPAESRDEVLYLGGDGLRPDAASDERSFRAAQVMPTDGAGALSTDAAVWGSYIRGGSVGLCPGASAFSASYVSEPLAAEADLAGNPFAYLRLEADQPGGIVALSLLELDPGTDCATGLAKNQMVAFGVADLRHHAGNLDDRPFPTNEPQSVRIDLMNLAEKIEAGHRLALVVYSGDHHHFGYEPRFAPNVTVHGSPDERIASQLVVPVTDGTVGGARPKAPYPPRPFTETRRSS